MKKLMTTLLALIVISVFLGESILANSFYFFREKIENAETFRYTKQLFHSYDRVWEETTDGNALFGTELNEIEYEHSVQGIIPSLLPDGKIYLVSLKIYISHGDERTMTMLIDSLDFDNVHKRKFFFKHKDHCDCNCDDDDDDDDSDDGKLYNSNNNALDGDDADCKCNYDQNNFLLLENSILHDGMLTIKIVSEDTSGADARSFTIKKSTLSIFYKPAMITDVPDSELPLPSKVDLGQNYPNPFNPETTIEFALQEKSHVTIDIINVRGQNIRTLLNDEKSAGAHSVVWNGRNNRGNIVSTGVYFYRITAGDYINANKMIMLK